MNNDLKRMWEEAELNPGENIDIGRIVVCDFCHADYTDSLKSGGVIFGSYAVCPKCSSAVEDERRRIRARCPPWLSFADFVREYRGPNCCISIQPLGK